MQPHIRPWSGDKQELDTVREIYLGSFPPEEQRPWEDIERRARGGSLKLIVFVDGAVTAGFLTAWDLGSLLYIEHFAISPALRGAGMGSAALDWIKAEAGKPVVVEVERPEAGEDARRRISFYRRSGFTPLAGYDYVQPPYSEGLPPVPLLLMSTDPTLDPASTARTLHTRVYGRNDID